MDGGDSHSESYDRVIESYYLNVQKSTSDFSRTHGNRSRILLEVDFVYTQELLDGSIYPL